MRYFIYSHLHDRCRLMIVSPKTNHEIHRPNLTQLNFQTIVIAMTYFMAQQHFLLLFCYKKKKTSCLEFQTSVVWKIPEKFCQSVFSWVPKCTAQTHGFIPGKTRSQSYGCDARWPACHAQEYDEWFPNKKQVWGENSRETKGRWWMESVRCIASL